MASLAGLAVGLGLVFGFLMLALAAEFYYLLFWRKRNAKRDHVEEGERISHGKFNCLKKPSVLNGRNDNNVFGRGTVPAAANGQDPELEIVKELPLSRISDDEEINVDTELMKLHGLAGPPRFLFTIKEESREDLVESEDGRSGIGSRSRTRSLSDLMVGLEGQQSSASPRRNSVSDSDFEFSFPFKSASPPPKFKFLRDAEEKFYWKQRVEAEIKRPTSSSQVIPLPSSALMDEKLTAVH